MGKRKSSAKPPPKKVRWGLSCRGDTALPRAARRPLSIPLSHTHAQTQQQPRNKNKIQAAPKLDTSFNCPFCNVARAVTCAIDLEHGLATARCGACGESYQTQADHLTEPVDVFSDWLDACEADGGR